MQYGTSIHTEDIGASLVETKNTELEIKMIFMLTYQIDRDKQVECQTFFTQMTDEQIAGEYPEGVKQIGRWHDMPNGNGVLIVETSDQEALTSFIMSWSGMCTFPIVKPVVDDATARKLMTAMLDSQ